MRAIFFFAEPLFERFRLICTVNNCASVHGSVWKGAYFASFTSRLEQFGSRSSLICAHRI